MSFLDSEPVYKYHAKISLIPECPPNPSTEETATVFRFVRKDITDPWNFIPQAEKDPKRKFKDDGDSCSGWALSVFNSQEAAKDFYNAMRNKRSRVDKILGTHLASVPITPTDGRLSAVRCDGHRDWHEYVTTSCAQKSLVIEQLHIEHVQVEG